VERVNWIDLRDRKRLKEEELFRAVKVQSWFRDSRERYWDEGQRGIAGTILRHCPRS
jgi:hypothetical protein